MKIKVQWSSHTQSRSRYLIIFRSIRIYISIVNPWQLNIAVAVEGDVNRFMMQLLLYLGDQIMKFCVSDYENLYRWQRQKIISRMYYNRARVARPPNEGMTNVRLKHLVWANHNAWVLHIVSIRSLRVELSENILTWSWNDIFVDSALSKWSWFLTPSSS